MVDLIDDSGASRAADWSASEVLDWLDSEGFSDCRDGFEAQAVDGGALLRLGPSELRDKFHVEPAIERERLLGCLRDLWAEWSAAEADKTAWFDEEDASAAGGGPEAKGMGDGPGPAETMELEETGSLIPDSDEEVQADVDAPLPLDGDSAGTGPAAKRPRLASLPKAASTRQPGLPRCKFGSPAPPASAPPSRARPQPPRGPAPPASAPLRGPVPPASAPPGWEEEDIGDDVVAVPRLPSRSPPAAARPPAKAQAKAAVKAQAKVTTAASPRPPPGPPPRRAL
mmetsp:Transcript_93271/g.278448  ORF Transcript_93271/g.278448 Transcript_93271/m.278448 type:complete len:284 (-) Transcript_93271:66-917(-)